MGNNNKNCCVDCGDRITPTDRKKLNKHCRRCWRSKQAKITVFIYGD